MARLPSFRRIFEQDYDPKDQELVRQLSVSINYGFEALYEILNGKLSLTDNTASLITTVNVEVNATGKPKTKTTIKKSGTERFLGFIVIKAENLTNSGIYTAGTPFINYTETTDSITINNVTGLPADNLFQLTLFGIR
jgi:hypothetical protein